MANPLRSYRAPDGTVWGVRVESPGSSNALVAFHHPDGASSSRDRYAWYIGRGPEARSVTARLDPVAVMKALSDADIARLFRRSWPVSRIWPTHPPVNRAS